MCGLCEITKNLINLDLIEIIQFWLMDGSFFWHFDFLLKSPQPFTGLFFLYFRLQIVLYLHSDSIHHGYLNKTGIVTVTKFNMNMVRKVFNLMVPRWQFGIPITLPVTVNNNLITTENKKFWNLKTTCFWNPKLEIRFVQNVLGS